MRIMALDIGEVRTGIAISDPDERVASPLCVLPTQEVVTNAKPFRRIVEDWEPEALLAGLPLTLSGEHGPQAAHIKELASTIAQNLQLPLEFEDERLSSQEAKRSLREEGLSEKQMRGRIDMIAASIFLQAWLDGRTANHQNH